MFYIGVVKTSSTTDWQLIQRMAIATPVRPRSAEGLPLPPELHSQEWYGRVFDRLAKDVARA